MNQKLRFPGPFENFTTVQCFTSRMDLDTVTKKWIDMQRWWAQGRYKDVFCQVCPKSAVIAIFCVHAGPI